ncbi:MAG: autotransporter-associated beta strand repeat-containing protein [Verrucomicrobiaceae bacterium]|nr:autotransporter-associated beta strand repeat-containing protein [Verrucomicrobiaceae bacterium]
MPLTKTGTGTLDISGTNTYEGSTAVTAGTLLANNTSGSATGTGSVTVAAISTLGGTGIIAPALNNSITISGLLAPGTTGATAGSDLALITSGTGNISLSTVTFDIFANTVGTNPLASNDRVLISATDWSNILFSGSKTLNVSTTLDSTTWNSGDNWQLFDWSGIAGGTAPTIGSGGFDVFNLPTLNSGLVWDTSALYTTGIITIAPEPTRALLLLLGLFGLAMRRRRK